MTVYRAFYVSRPVGDGGQHVKQILAQCQIKNRRLDITGMLAFSGDHFVQVLEGHETDVRPLLDTVMADRRHCDLRLVLEERSFTREYAQWSMGYVEGFGAAQRIESLLSGAPDLQVAAFVRRLFEPRL